MDKVQKPSNSECYAPSSEPFRIYRLIVFEKKILTFDPSPSFFLMPKFTLATYSEY
jgi:hypothetical protein